MLRLMALALVGVGLYGGPFWRRGGGVRMEATAFAPDGKPTSAGTVPHRGVVAADPAVLPFGSRIRITGAGRYNGTYTVTDTGTKISGKHVDLFFPTAAEAKRFGKRVVTVQVIQKGGGKEDAREKDIPAKAAR